MLSLVFTRYKWATDQEGRNASRPSSSHILSNSGPKSSASSSLERCGTFSKRAANWPNSSALSSPISPLKSRALISPENRRRAKSRTFSEGISNRLSKAKTHAHKVCVSVTQRRPLDNTQYFVGLSKNAALDYLRFGDIITVWDAHKPASRILIRSSNSKQQCEA